MKPVEVSPQMGNYSAVPGSCQRETHHMSILVLLCFVFFLGLLLNSFSLWVFCCRMPCWTSGTTLQFHLALSDAIAFPVFPMMAAFMNKNWPWFLCQVKIALLSSHFCGSTIFLTLISIHRYTVVVHFNKDSPMKRKQFVRKLCAGVWFLLLIQALVYAFLLSRGNVDSYYDCLSIYQGDLTDKYFAINLFLFLFGFLLPLVVSVVCYTRLASSLTRLNISTPKSLKARVKSQRMIGMCLVIFGLCFLPLNVIRTVAVVLKKCYPEECHVLRQIEKAYYSSLILAGVNSCLDPLLYCFGSQNFRNALPSVRNAQRDAAKKDDSKMSANQ